MATGARIIFVVMALASITGCTTTPPSNQQNLCEIFREKDGWYTDAADARENWGSPIAIMMAIMHQESRFQAKAKPPRNKLLGFIPWFRSSSAYGYSQAKSSTWDWYQTSSGNYGADRDDFEDAIDFIGWYTDGSQKRLKLSKWDAYGQYLAYHEGRGGYSRKTFNKKPWLKKVAAKVKRRSSLYNTQLKSCKRRLDDAVDSWF